ncbi:hypothetical protein POSPLADRAFT_1073870 [Postia placenta MAD-698-R-SB12]|uniref:Uncharacterized protein n=1 Tax=Postia placenta MAD-698-R-SB12 TaxID=670580 RepID=A0A1X6N758_9APHY|nr:hypothetical protein POSPLADRAFT_1073870 [Postia placenta MAD-698-R-SB12]OSX64340.1 hypothetical protein POSPLADRAFT_1073870 [Postia placenta MAD-698-R-SB12]
MNLRDPRTGDNRAPTPDPHVESITAASGTRRPPALPLPCPPNPAPGTLVVLAAPDAPMQVSPVCSPTFVGSPTTPSARTRPPLPHGPRGPKSASKSSPKSAIPLDTFQRCEEATPAYSSPRSSTAWSPSSPAFSGLGPDAPSECGSSASRRNTTSRGVQTSVGESVAPSRTVSGSPAVKVLKKMAALSQPPPPNFESVPVQWRGMTLEAAQWNMTSEQLQEIVSVAIRASAQESFIRLVPLQVYNEELGKEVERLEVLKATTQSQYRFNVHRRMMLMRSLNALSFAPSSEGGDYEALVNLTCQLAEVTASCDRLMETLLTVSDQRAQIQRIQDVHVASALGIALRKLNASYGRRATDLATARAKVDELTEELEEAWKVAEELAQEMDDLDNFEFPYPDEQFGDTSAVIGETSTERSVQLAEVIEITGKAVATKAAYANVSTPQSQVADRASRVSAARRRSVRASKASLRLPRSPKSPPPSAFEQSATLRRARSRSKSRRRPSVVTDSEAPQIPTIQVDTATYKGGSFLELTETRPTSPATTASPEAHPPLPQLIVMSPTSKRETLDVPSLSPHMALPSPAFDRTIIPPLTTSGAKDDAWHRTEHERRASARRVQSWQPRSRTDPLPQTLLAALRRANSDHRRPSSSWLVQENARPPKAKRYSVRVAKDPLENVLDTKGTASMYEAAGNEA